MDPIEKINLFCTEIEKELEIYGDIVSENLIHITYDLFTFTNSEGEEYKKIAEEKLKTLANNAQKYTKVWLYSAALALTFNAAILEEFLQYIIEEKTFSANIKYFLYYQIKATVFRYTSLEQNNIKYLKWKLLEQIVGQFKTKIQDLLIPIPLEERDHNLAVVITEQLRDGMHSPSKIALDRCKILIEEMHKKVLLINTAEILSQVGCIPYYGSFYGNYWDEMLSQEILEWKGTKIPFFQCENNMPNTTDLRTLLQTIRNIKPGLVIAIGGSGILANLIDTIIPVLTVGLTPSALEATMTTCQTLSRSLPPEDLELLHKLEIDNTSVIQSIFTSSLMPQVSTVTREELGLPQNKFVIVIVGYRLDTDIDASFMEMLNQAVDDDIVIAMIGTFKSYTDYRNKIPTLEGKIHCLGLTRDILAWLAVCDLFVNPYRRGGGTSGVEALYQGIPVVTTPYGDVATNAGADFWTDSYETMPALIRKYKNDTAFYHEMSVKAKERAKILLDTAGEFKRIIGEFEKRSQI